ncbi:PREDICTED: uncharacterized protein LOC109466270 isoform X2 [Branchiostoma belcheri]|uniref:Uncharacterized protein LOC109466270 isoform X2 n=1 Tax=Branchiostoma belcheri TaxID=7741 RepID=A0A6P4YLD7_BRABE|nr:PREDICTED: uncharacterized protein LOC109466270 isoform X2 [Branchiostoma belcheri]
MANMTALPPQPRKSNMTFWSRHSPVMMSWGDTDHWSKMKHKATTFTVSMPGLNIIDYKDPRKEICRPHQRPHKGSQRDCSEQALTMAENPHHHGNFHYREGKVSRLPPRDFSGLIVQELHGNIPGEYFARQQQQERAKSSPASRWALHRNTYNERAREGFKYWQLDRPKPTKYGRYGMGSKGTVLGLGNGPRT